MSRIRDRLAATVKDAAARLNLDMHRRDLTHPARRIAAMRHRCVDLVLDVGANRGQYVDQLRAHDYPSAVISFEPIPEVFDDLTAHLSADRAWRGLRLVAGSSDEPVTSNVSNDTVTSSVLDPSDRLVTHIPSAAASRQIEVKSRRLEGLWPSLAAESRAVMLEVDVQGFEHGVLDGLGARVDDVVLIEVEMGLTGLYEGGSSIHDLLPRLTDAGFSVVSLDSGFVDPATGQVLDIDVLMGR